MQHLQYKLPRYNIKIAGLFAPATSTFIHRTTTHFISLFCYPHPYKNRNPSPITPPQFAPFYRTLSPLIREHKALPWQMKSIFIIVLFLLDSPRNALFCEGFRGFVKYVFLLASWQNRARWSKLLRAVSSKVGSKLERLTTKFFITLLLKIDLPLFNPFR